MGIETALALGTLAVSAAGVAASAGAFGGGPKPDVMPAPPKEMNPNTEVANNENKKRQQVVANKGRKGTILTSPLGAEDPASTPTASLLGS